MDIKLHANATTPPGSAPTSGQAPPARQPSAGAEQARGQAHKVQHLRQRIGKDGVLASGHRQAD